MVPLFSSLRTRSSADCHCFEQLCVEYKESNNNEITSSAEKVVRPWPDRPDRRLRPCLKIPHGYLIRVLVSECNDFEYCDVTIMTSLVDSP